MKNLITLLSFITIFCIRYDSNAQSLNSSSTNTKYKYPERNSIITLYPFAFVSGNFKIGFEQRLSEGATIKIMPSIGLADQSNFYGIDNYFGFSVEGMLKYFPMKQSPNGFYGSVYLFYAYAQGGITNTLVDGSVSITTTSNGTVSAGGGGVCFGGQFNIKNVFFVDMYLGGGPVIPSGKYFFPDQNKVGLLGGSNQLTGFSRGISGHAGISLGIPLK